jgi:hypothetical protein
MLIFEGCHERIFEMTRDREAVFRAFRYTSMEIESAPLGGNRQTLLDSLQVDSHRGRTS